MERTGRLEPITPLNMSIQRIPNEQKQVIQSNVGDYGGNLWSTFNVDLHTNPGTIKTSRKLTQAITSDTIGTDIVQAFSIYNNNYYIVTNDRVFTCSTNNDPTDENNWSEISTLGAEDLGVETDAVVLNNQLLISLGTDVMAWDGSTKDEDWWTNNLVMEKVKY